MTLAWDLENLRELVRMRLGDPYEQKRYMNVINRIAKRFKEIENAIK